jgi:hypothetical protein
MGQIGRVTPRGVVNDNPGNLRDGRFFDGYIKQDSLDFAIFQSPLLGVRALMRDLLTARYVHNRVTLEEIMAAYAPQQSNPLDAYITYVRAWLRLSERATTVASIELSQPWRLLDLSRAIVSFENGFCWPTWPSYPEWYAVDLMAQAVALELKKRPT